MSALFDKKKSREKTIAILDVENGSVGAALVRVSANDQPKLFAQTRAFLPLTQSISAGALAAALYTAAREALVHESDVAARLRMHVPTASVGEIVQVAIFLHAPWVSIHVDGPDATATDAPAPLLAQFRDLAEESFGEVPVSFHAFGTTAAPAVHGIFDSAGAALIVSLTGEVTELFLTRDGALIGHATAPVGLHTLLRTLQSHGGLSRTEARSALALINAHAVPDISWAEAFESGSSHVLAEVGTAAQALVRVASVQDVFVIAPQMNSVWLAKALARDDALSDLFPDGGTIRDIHAGHLSPFVAAHASIADTELMIESLCVDSRFGIY
jgi:hypothetical protein